jgi:type II secretory pathway pseudopilin PulG
MKCHFLPTHNKKKQRGLSLIELALVTALLGLTIAAVTRFIVYSQKGLANHEARTDLIATCKLIGENLRRSISTSQILFTNYQAHPGLATDYRIRIEAGRNAGSAPSPVNFSVLPLVAATEKEAVAINGNHFGNQLMFAAVINPLKLKVETDACATCQEEVILDRFQFVHIYLSAWPEQNFPGFTGPDPYPKGPVHLVEWRSVPYINYSQLANLYGKKLTETAKALNAQGYNWAWDSGVSNASTAFYQIRGTGTPVLLGGTAGPATFPEYSWARMQDFKDVQTLNFNPLTPLGRINRLGNAGQLTAFKTLYSVAYNSVSPTVNPQYKVNELIGMLGPIQVPQLAEPDLDSKIGFPGGFEVMILGTSGTRQMYSRIVLMAFAPMLNIERDPKVFIASETISYSAFKNPY